MTEYKQGDLIFVRTHHFVSKLIRFGQRSYGPQYAQWNHVAVYTHTTNGKHYVVEALTSGVTKSCLDKYAPADLLHKPAVPRALVRTHPVEANLRFNAAAFAENHVGDKYGFLTIAAIALKVLFKGKLNFGVQGSDICSGLAARSLERMGYDFGQYDPGELTPAYLVELLG
jgi:uncharacterized protein YycO